MLSMTDYNLPWITSGFDLNNINQQIPSYLIGPRMVPYVNRGGLTDATISYTMSPNYEEGVNRIVNISKGGKQIAAGTAILLVPDPLPVVDELVGLALIGQGAYNIYRGLKGF